MGSALRRLPINARTYGYWDVASPPCEPTGREVKDAGVMQVLVAESKGVCHPSTITSSWRIQAM